MTSKIRFGNIALRVREDKILYEVVAENEMGQRCEDDEVVALHEMLDAYLDSSWGASFGAAVDMKAIKVAIFNHLCCFVESRENELTLLGIDIGVSGVTGMPAGRGYEPNVLVLITVHCAGESVELSPLSIWQANAVDIPAAPLIGEGRSQGKPPPFDVACIAQMLAALWLRNNFNRNWFGENEGHYVCAA